MDTTALLRRTGHWEQIVGCQHGFHAQLCDGLLDSRFPFPNALFLGQNTAAETGNKSGQNALKFEFSYSPTDFSSQALASTAN